MWGSYTFPQCHNLIRVRRNYTVRILRLALITPILLYLLAAVSAWLRLHLRISIFVSVASIGLIDEFLMRLLPAKIEPAVPGGFIAS